MKLKIIASVLAILFCSIPTILMAQSAGNDVSHFHQVLANLLDKMVPLAKDLMDVARVIGGFGALWYIGVRVWRHLAAAEPIDFFPLFRPFVITIVISLYPAVLKIMDGILYPTVAATNKMVKDSDNAVAVLLEQRGEAILKSEEWKTLSGGIGGGEEDWKKYEETEESEGLTLGKAISFSISLFTNSITYLFKYLLSIVLQIIYFAASLCIDAMRTFQLLILSLLGPFVLAISIYDGFQQTLVSWIGRYINVYLWLPVANLFGAMIGKIQQGMLEISIQDMANGNIIGFGETDIAYLIFLLVAIFGYFSIPSITNYIIQASGTVPLLSKVASAAVSLKTAGIIK